jgi:hypothetical protein
MSRPASIAVSVAIWAVCLVPAVALAMWFGMVEATWLGALKAAVVLTLIAVIFEALQRGVARRRVKRGER